MFVLIIYIFAGVFAKGDSVTVTSVPNFSSESQCIIAAKKVTEFTNGTTKDVRVICVKQ
jgi:hypothetical protein